MFDDGIENWNDRGEKGLYKGLLSVVTRVGVRRRFVKAMTVWHVVMWQPT